MAIFSGPSLSKQKATSYLLAWEVTQWWTAFMAVSSIENLVLSFWTESTSLEQAGGDGDVELLVPLGI